MLFPSALLNYTIEEITGRPASGQTMSPELWREIIVRAYQMIIESHTKEQMMARVHGFYDELGKAKDENEREAIVRSHLKAEIGLIAEVIEEAEKEVLGEAIERLKQKKAQDSLKS